MLPIIKVDKMNLINISWVFVIGISYTIGAIGIILLSNLTKLSVALILFTVFEWISAGHSTVILLYLATRDKVNKKVVNRMRITNTFFIIASTAVGIYWIDNMMLENVIEKQLYIRQLKVSLTTLFVISVLFKFTFFVILLPTNGEKHQHNNDIEATHNFETNSLLSIKNSLKLKDSLQTLISQKSGNSVKENNEKVTQYIHAGLNMKFAERFPVVKSTESIIETSDTTTEILNNIPTTTNNNTTFIKSQILTDARDEKKVEIPTTPILAMLSNCITEEDLENSNDSVLLTHHINKITGSNYLAPSYGNNGLLSQDETDEDRDIQMLNISEPLFPGDVAERLHADGHHISAKTWRESAPQLLQMAGCTDDHGYFYNELNREIRQNGSLHSLHIQQSLPNLKQDTCKPNISLQRGGSFTKILRGSFSTSNLTANHNHSGYNSISERTTLNTITTSDCNNKLETLKTLKTLNPNHQKSTSLSELSFPNISGSRSLSPLKKLRNFKESIQSTPNASKSIGSPSQSGNGNNGEFELDLNLANSIRSSSPKKKLSSRSLNSRRVSLVTSPIRNNLSSSISVQDLSTNRPIKYDDELALESDDDEIDIVEDYYSPSRRKKHLIFNIDDFKNINNINNIINSQKRTTSGHSNTDSSTLSNNSVPSGYYGEYDKEKWRAFKKFQHGSIYQE